MMEHEMRLACSVSDDGIWLQCSCGWEYNALPHPTVAEVAVAAELHVTAAALVAVPRCQARYEFRQGDETAIVRCISDHGHDGSHRTIAWKHPVEWDDGEGMDRG